MDAGCVWTECRDVHNSCNVTLAPVIDAVKSAIAENDFAEVRALMKDDPHIEYNARRSAIQVIGCDSTVLLHVPLSRAKRTSLLH